MGNCQAAEAATVVIHHPGGKVERAYWSLSASQVMAANPGHYVAVIVDGYPSRLPPPALQSSTSSFRAYRSCSGSSSAGGAAPVKHLKLLRPDDALHIGHVYRLVSFEEVVREFAWKRHVKLSRLLFKEEEKTRRPRRGGHSRRGRGGATTIAGARRRQSRNDGGSGAAETDTSPATEQKEEEVAAMDAELEEVVRGMMTLGNTTRSRASFGGVGGGAPARHGQWRPALQSIAEVGS
ncbi:hypothetical protein OPV22_035137 [Ensete ventricosum]|uniref:DUF4228 domain-containing protein n=1 Tax=Ensete ventricosum TaxID=4639 RepID=A0AAX5MSW5_ENSVE|nr:hypothetical protein OPV22_035137 [Ensete ventricosum]